MNPLFEHEYVLTMQNIFLDILESVVLTSLNLANNKHNPSNHGRDMTMSEVTSLAEALHKW